MWVDRTCKATFAKKYLALGFSYCCSSTQLTRVIIPSRVATSKVTVQNTIASKNKWNKTKNSNANRQQIQAKCYK